MTKRDIYKIHDKEEIITKRERKRRSNFHYSPEQKASVLALYASEMTLEAISEQTGVPYSTLRFWKSQVWWQTMLDEIRGDNEEIFRFRAQQIVDKATKAVLERLELGDEVIDKNGKIQRRKITGKDAAVIGAVFFDKLRTSLNMPNVIHKHVDETNLKDLAENFRKVAREFDAKIVSIADVPHETLEISDRTHRTDGETGGSDGSEASPRPRDGHNGTDCAVDAENPEGEVPTRH